MQHDDEREFHRLYALRTVIFDMLQRYPNEMSIWNNLNEKQQFAITRLANLCSVLEAIYGAKHTVAKAMLARAVIEINADILAVFKSVDPEQGAKDYGASEYAFYKQLKEELNQVRSLGRFSKTKYKKRIYEYKGTWIEMTLTKRIRMIDNGTDAITWYDVLSHFSHANLSHGMAEFELFTSHLNYAVSYYAATSIFATVSTGIFIEKEIKDLSIFTQDIIEGIVDRPYQNVS